MNITDLQITGAAINAYKSYDEYLAKCRDFEKGAKWAISQASQWVKMEDKLPPVGQPVLLMFKKSGNLEVGTHIIDGSGIKWIDIEHSSFYYQPTDFSQWIEIPEKPIV